MQMTWGGGVACVNKTKKTYWSSWRLWEAYSGRHGAVTGEDLWLVYDIDENAIIRVNERNETVRQVGGADMFVYPGALNQ